MDSTAFFRTMSLRTGDVLALLRSLRSFYERRSIPFQTQLRKDLIKMALSDYPDWKHYVAAMDVIFTKLAALGELVPDQVKRFHLLEGLGDEYHSIISTVLAYEGPGGGHADYNKAVEIISAYEENFAARRRKKAHDTTMVARPPFKRGSLGDAPMRTRGGGDAHPYPGTQEPCIYFLKRGRCFRGDRCHFRHIQPPAGTSVISKDRHKNQGKRNFTSSSSKGDQPVKTCFYCGKKGHIKRECRKRSRDSARVAVDFACPAVEFTNQAFLPVGRVGLEPQVTDGADTVQTADGDAAGSKWLVDGGASCHVLGFDPGASLNNRQQAAIEIQVGGGHKIFCSCVGDLSIMVT